MPHHPGLRCLVVSVWTREKFSPKPFLAKPERNPVQRVVSRLCSVLTARQIGASPEKVSPLPLSAEGTVLPHLGSSQSGKPQRQFRQQTCGGGKGIPREVFACSNGQCLWRTRSIGGSILHLDFADTYGYSTRQTRRSIFDRSA